MPSKKGPHKGTGGHGRRQLEGKGPTPKAEDRPGHPAYRRKRSAAKRATKQPTAAQAPRRSGPSRARGVASDEVVAGRNAVVEALRAAVPALALYVANGLTRDERIDEIRKRAGDLGLSMLEAGRTQLDRLSGGAPHQGVVLQVRPFDYEQVDDVLRRAPPRCRPAGPAVRLRAGRRLPAPPPRAATAAVARRARRRHRPAQPRRH